MKLYMFTVLLWLMVNIDKILFIYLILEILYHEFYVPPYLVTLLA